MVVFLANALMIITSFFIHMSSSTSTSEYRLIFLISADKNKIHQINEKNPFTNKLNKGWIFESDMQYNVALNIKYNVYGLNHSVSHVPFKIFFTTNELNCNRNNSNDYATISHDFIATNSNLNKKILLGNINMKFPYSKSKYYACLMKNNDYEHQGTNNIYTSIITTKALMPIYVVFIFYFILMCLSALFSGLNLGLMSLDLTELKVLKKIGLSKERLYALKIYPLRKRGNFLLCTLLLGNVLVNSTSTLILGSYVDGIFAAVGSTLFIVLFGEIIPQAICSRYGLAVGTYTRHITYVFMFLTSPLSYPLSKVLDRVLGKQTASTYTREKVRELMAQANGLEEKEKKLISGALDFKNKSVKDVMMSINEVFTLDINDVLDFDTFQKIAIHGYSRIPIYEHTKENLIGMIRIQDLLLNDPADKLPLRGVVEFYKRKVAKCSINDKLDDMFDIFRHGESHMGFVYLNDPKKFKPDETNEAVGIVTLEDVIEELVQNEIMDESDCKRESRKKRAKEALRGKLKPIEDSDQWNIFVRQADLNKPLISPQIRKALFHFLNTSVKPFTSDFINAKLLDGVLKHPDFIKEKLNLNDKDMYIYKFGEECDFFLIILNGNAVMEIGKEKIQANAGLFSYYGLNALLSDVNQTVDEVLANESNIKPYVPEFSLKIEQYCVYFQITRDDWIKLVKNSNLERKYSLSPI